MPARTKGRAKFDFRGRPFVWWVDDEYWLRISSLDKKFVIAYALGKVGNSDWVVGVYGAEFPGLSPSEPRPVWLVAPEPCDGPMGALVHQLLTWSFDPSHQLNKCGAPP